MKAIVYTKFGPPEVLELKEVEKPAPKDNEVLIRVHATSVNFGDTMARNFKAISPREFNRVQLLTSPTHGLASQRLTSDHRWARVPVRRI